MISDDTTPDAAALSPELGKAHLLRLRGDLSAAIDQCLTVLKKNPDHHEAHVMLGDLHAEAGSLDQAAEWYELALDLRPDAEGDKVKLAAVRDRLRAQETEARIESLGLPPERNSTPMLAGGLLALVAVIALLGWMFGRDKKSTGGRIATSIAAPAPDPVETGVTTAPPPITTPAPVATAPTPVTVPSPATAVTRADESALNLLRQRSTEGARLLSLASDPRARMATLTASAEGVAEPRRLAATLGRDLLENDPAMQVVVVRLLRAGELVLVADVSRSRLAETGAPGWADANGGPDAWIDHVLTNESPAPPRASEAPTVPDPPADNPDAPPSTP